MSSINRTRLLFILIVIVALVIVAISLPNQNSEEGGTNAPTPVTVPSGSVELAIASSSTKQAWMEEIVEQFNADGVTINNGETIFAHVTPVLSGGSKNDILADRITPVVWSPGSGSWVAQLNDEWRVRHNQNISSESCESTIYTPLGLAMWRPMAETLGWPDTPISWETLVTLAGDPDGWGSYGRPEWGRFLFGQAHPGYSNAGLLTTTSFIYDITGKTGDLAAGEVYDADVTEALTTLAQNTSKYGRVTTNLLDQMVQQGPSYLHAVATFESDTVRFNIEYEDQLQFPLAFIFPAGGTFWGNHPYCTLDNAEWVTDEQAEAAEIFRQYMLEREQQTLAVKHLLRPLDSNIPLASPLDLEHGTDPRVNVETVPALPSPDAQLGAAIIDQFLQTKRKATVTIVLDISGSMEGDKIRTAVASTVEFLERLAPDDEISALVFNDELYKLEDPSPVRDVVESLSDRVSSLTAGGGTALYDSICRSVEQVEGLRMDDQRADENRLYGIVLLSDGQDTGSTVSETQMFTQCLPTQAEADGIKIYPIAFGEDADTDVLQRVAKVTGGRLFQADPDSISRVYVSISAEQ
ncbi:MAG: VWA domain-containing protein [Chloroflexota bacterium]